MKEFDNIVIGNSAIPSLIIAVTLMLAIPVIFFIYWRNKHKPDTKISWLIAGKRTVALKMRFCMG